MSTQRLEVQQRVMQYLVSTQVFLEHAHICDVTRIYGFPESRGFERQCRIEPSMTFLPYKSDVDVETPNLKHISWMMCANVMLSRNECTKVIAHLKQLVGGPEIWDQMIATQQLARVEDLQRASFTRQDETVVENKLSETCKADWAWLLSSRMLKNGIFLEKRFTSKCNIPVSPCHPLSY